MAILIAGACPSSAEEPKSAPPKAETKPAAEAPKAEPKPAETPKSADKDKPPAKPAETPKPPDKDKPPAKPAPKPPAPPPEPLVPYITYVFPAGGQVGKTVPVTLGGLHVQGATAVRVSGEGVTAALVEITDPKEKGPKAPVIKRADGTTEQTEIVRLTVTIAPDAKPGMRDLRIITPGGMSNRFRFVVGQLPEVNEVEPNSEKPQAQRLDAIPVVVNGQVLQADRDLFRFPAKAGETLVFAVQAQALLPFIADAVPAWLQAILTLYDPDGKEVAYQDGFRFKPDPVLIYPVPKDGEYTIEIKDSLYRGREDFIYRLSVGALPYITDVYPLGARRGTLCRVELRGANLPAPTLEVAVPADGPSPWHVDVTRDGIASNVVPFDAGTLEETSETEPNDGPAQANPVKAPSIINGRIGRPGDVDRFTFEAQAKQELVLEVRARRLDSPLDSVLTILDSQGRPLTQNDDAIDDSQPLLTHHADSRVAFTFPTAGLYAIRLGDAQGKGGEAYAYRLSIAPPQPDFALRVFPDNVRIGPGDTVAVTAAVLRKDGFAGDVQLALKDLPDGFVLRGAVIPPKENEVRFTITAPAGLKAGLLSPTVVGTGKVAGQDVTRPASPAELVMQAFSIKHRVPTAEFAMAVIESDFFTLMPAPAADQAVEVPQGGEAQVTVKVARGKKGQGQLRIYADQAPRSVTVKSVGVPPDASEGTVTLTASKTAVVGLTQNLVLSGALRIGKDNVIRVAPAVQIRVVAPAAAATPASPAPAAPAPQK